MIIRLFDHEHAPVLTLVPDQGRQVYSFSMRIPLTVSSIDVIQDVPLAEAKQTIEDVGLKKAIEILREYQEGDSGKWEE